MYIIVFNHSTVMFNGSRFVISVMISINQYQPLFLVSVSVISERCKDIVISVLIMSIIVIITSLIAS